MPDAKFSAFELKPGSLYRVKAQFADYHRIVHAIGESWRFQSHDFVPYHAGLRLNLVDQNGPRVIFFQDDPEEQGEVVSRFSDYVEEILPPRLDANRAPAPG